MRKIATKLLISGSVFILSVLISTTSFAQVTTPTPPYAIGDEITGNGDFEAFELGAITEGALNWAFNITTNGASAAFEIVEAGEANDEKALKVDFGTFNNAPDRDYDVEAVNEPFNVVEGDVYEAKVWLKADTDSRLAKYYFNLPATGGWARYEEVLDTLTTEWKQYTVRHIASATDEANSMRFSISLNLADNDGGTIWMDNLSIKKLSEAAVETSGTWGFEALSFGDWIPLVDLPFSNNTTGEITNEQASSGSYSAKIQVADNALVGALINNNYDVGVADTLRAQVFINASELSEIEMVQIFVLHGEGWAFSSNDIPSSSLTADSWNTIEFIGQEGISFTQRIGIQFVGKDTTGTAFMYIDDIEVAEFMPSVFEPEGTWGFENDILGDWAPLMDSEFEVNTTGMVTSEKALSGTYSAKIQVGTDGSLGALINNVYKVEAGDTLRANVFIEASEIAKIDSIQIFVLHGNNWDFSGITYSNSVIQGFADTWTELEIAVPSGVGATQRLGVQFIKMEASDSPIIYIDDISVTKLGTSTSSEYEDEPLSIMLEQNYPNPFNPTTQISYVLPNSSKVTLSVFNMLGQKVATLVDAPQTPGSHTVRFDASNLTSGIYLYRIQAGTFSQVKRMTLIK